MMKRLLVSALICEEIKVTTSIYGNKRKSSKLEINNFFGPVRELTS
jgi:hypothetical protein